MPEGDTVFKVAAALRPLLAGRVVRRVVFGRGPGIGPPCVAAEGRRVEAVRSEGKHLWIDFEGGLSLRSHLGMHGTWHRYDSGEPWRKPDRQASLALWTDRDALVCFHAREVECLRRDGFRGRDASARLGPDLLAEEADLGEVARRARELVDPEAPIVDVLLDQRVAAGIGNVYKSEALFLEGIPPQTSLGGLVEADLRRLFETAQSLLRRNVGRGPRVTRFEADGRGILWVYGRRGKPCLRCGQPIRCSRLGRGLRPTWWCPKCQASAAEA